MKQFSVLLDLFNKDYTVSSLYEIYTGRETPSGKDGYEFKITLFAKNRYQAIKEAKKVVKNSNWLKNQNLNSFRFTF